MDTLQNSGALTIHLILVGEEGTRGEQLTHALPIRDQPLTRVQALTTSFVREKPAICELKIFVAHPSSYNQLCLGGDWFFRVLSITMFDFLGLPSDAHEPRRVRRLQGTGHPLRAGWYLVCRPPCYLLFFPSTCRFVLCPCPSGHGLN